MSTISIENSAGNITPLNTIYFILNTKLRHILQKKMQQELKQMQQLMQAE